MTQTKKKPQNDTDLRTRAVTAALALAAQGRWADVTLADIAAQANVPLAALRRDFRDRADILAVWGDMIDATALEAAGPVENSSALPPRDRLFDLLMARFDVLGGERDAVLSILASIRSDPKQAVIGLPHLARSMSWMLEAAGLSTAGLPGAAKVAGLTALYLKTLTVWAKDDSPDMGRTMAALDSALGRAERWAERLFPGPGPL